MKGLGKANLLWISTQKAFVFMSKKKETEDKGCEEREREGEVGLTDGKKQDLDL